MLDLTQTHETNSPREALLAQLTSLAPLWAALQRGESDAALSDESWMIAQLMDWARFREHHALLLTQQWRNALAPVQRQQFDRLAEALLRQARQSAQSSAEILRTRLRSAEALRETLLRSQSLPTRQLDLDGLLDTKRYFVSFYYVSNNYLSLLKRLQRFVTDQQQLYVHPSL